MNIVTVFKLNWVIAFFSLLLFLFFFGVESWVIANVSVGFDFWIGLLGDLIGFVRRTATRPITGGGSCTRLLFPFFSLSHLFFMTQTSWSSNFKVSISPLGMFVFMVYVISDV